MSAIVFNFKGRHSPLTASVVSAFGCLSAENGMVCSVMALTGTERLGRTRRSNISKRTLPSLFRWLTNETVNKSVNLITL